MNLKLTRRKQGRLASAWSSVFFLAALLITPFLALGPLPTAQAVSTNLVISQVYGGGGNSAAPYNSDFIEIFNRGSSPVSLNGKSVQYASATGTGSFGANSSQLTVLPNVTLQPGQYFLIQEAGGITGAVLPTPDVSNGSINLSATGGKVALVNSTTSLGCNGSTTNACSSAQLALIIDLVGYDGANFFEGAGAAPTLSNITAAFRAGNGCTDTDNNLADFTAATPAPRNSSTTTVNCGATGSTNPTGVGSASPATVLPGDSTTLSVTVTPGTNPASTGITVSADLSSVGDGTQNLSNGGSGNVYTLNYSVPSTVSGGSKTIPVTVSDAQGRTSTTSISLNVATLTPIYTIQGAALVSPYAGQTVSTSGVVTGLKSNGFFLQDPVGDNDPNTSDGVFVFTSSRPTVTIGHTVQVSGSVTEFKGASDSQPLTEISIGRTGSVSDKGAYIGPAIQPVIITTDPSRTGPNIRQVPTQNIEDDNDTVYDPATDGLDLYESLEGMLVEVDNPLVVGPTIAFFSSSTGQESNREIYLVPDNGTGATGLTSRKSISISPNDFNPERIIINDLGLRAVNGGVLPVANVSDKLTGAIVGPLDYTFSNYKIQVTSVPTLVSGNLQPEVQPNVTNPNQLRVVNLNVENFIQKPTSPDDLARADLLASQIVNNLKSPDLLTLEEIQDDSGSTNDGTVTSEANLTRLRDLITSKGGATYQWRYIAPCPGNLDGGEPGGNIRQVFFFRTDRGLSFVDKPGAACDTPNSVNPDGTLQYSPGRIDPTNTAFNSSRKPLAGEFVFQGQRFTVIANHLNSKGGDNPLYGDVQPPVLSSEVQRRQQATIIRNFVSQIQTANPNALVLVTGDLNDFEFSNPLKILKGENPAVPANQVLSDIVERPEVAAEKYSYIFEGNAQVLDHVLYSQAFGQLLARPDINHMNSEFSNLDPRRETDHEAIVADFDFSPKVSFSTQPGGALINQPLNPQPVVVLKDTFGNVLTGYNGTVTIAIKAGTGAPGATLSGTLTVPVVNGLASFTDLSIDKAATGYVLVATTNTGISVESDPFTISNPVPTLTSLVPTYKLAGSNDFTLTVNGTNFVPGAVVLWNGTALPTNFVSSTQLTAQVAKALVASEGIATITVSNPGPGGGASANSLPFYIAVKKTVRPTAAQLSDYRVLDGDTSGNRDASNPVSNLADAQNYTYWRWTGYPKAVAIETNFGAPTTVAGLRLFTQAPGHPVTVYVQYLDNTGKWSDVPGLSNITDASSSYGLHTYSVPEITSTKFRIVLDNLNYTSDIGYFGDLQFDILSANGVTNIAPVSGPQAPVAHRLGITDARDTTGGGNAQVPGLLDGQPSTGWVRYNAGTGTLALDLGSEKTLSSLSYFLNGSGGPANIQVELVGADNTVRQSFQFTSNGGYGLQALPAFASQPGVRYIRFTVTTTTGNKNVGGFGDVQAFGF